ncbi:Histidine triad nucleotide-binding protein 3 [Ananas comosus]|uniref:Histidine triad nucleotide-binding protein 3 n=1 Tax=Ananas comosus TaxID=4615 RepID=A0A199VW40_ANACO|nr:Histidine triad nucleotide-binding protein 3 [Ananas comosus]
MKHFCFGASKSEAPRSERRRMASAAVDSCIFCPIARGSTSTTLLYAVKSLFSPLFPLKFGPKLTSFFTFRALIQDEKVVAFPDVNPSAFRHYLVIPVEHISTVNHLQRTAEDYQLVNHMLRVGKDLLRRDAPDSVQYRFGFHQPPFNSVNHLHLHCLALPFIPSWRKVKYMPLGPFRGFIEAEKLLNRIKPQSVLNL